MHFNPSRSSRVFSPLLLLVMSISLIAFPVKPVQAQEETPTITPTGTPVTAQGIIDSFNALRRSHNMRSLIVDPILAGLAQQTADIMAINGMSGHIGGVRDRAIAAGYGAGDIPWLTENFAIGPMSLEELMMAWSDADHMRGANNLWYAHCGVGISEYNGDVYYVFIAGYTSNRIYKPGATALPGQTLTAPISQVMFPVVRVTPGNDGKIIHTVKHGQTLWAIAIAYGTHILDIQRANGMTADRVDLSEGQKLLVPITGDSLAPTETASTHSSENRIVISPGPPTEFPTPTPLPLPPPDESKPLSGEFIIVLAAILLAVGLIGFGLFVSRRDGD
jgi:LysM repeat protein